MQTAIDRSGSTRELLVHKDLAGGPMGSFPSGLNSKVIWAELQLAMSGRTPRMKGTVGHSVHWRRTPIHGNDFYLWWIPSGTRGSEPLSRQMPGSAIFVRAVRHHDETDHLLPLGDLSEYKLVAAGELDPRYADQRKVAEDAWRMPTIDVRVVAGHPGSGKTVALLYTAYWLAARSDDGRHVLYVTYTENLAEQARRFFETCNIAYRVRVLTLGALIAEFTGLASAQVAPENHAGKITVFAEGLIKASRVPLGAWSTHIPALWTEIRAFLLGMALPYEWERQGVGTIVASEVLDRASYMAIRRDFLGEDVSDSAWQIGNRALLDQDFCRDCFADQVAARQALDRLLASHNGSSPVFGDLRAIVVDEIQDFTLLQIALLTELARHAVLQPTPFCFVLAGDESQTVHPSGFDLGVTKDFLRHRLQSTPQHYELSGQRRCPERLAQLVDTSWGLYTHFLKDQRSFPKRKQTPSDHQADAGGTLLRWRLTTGTDWSAALAELGGYPDLAIVDLASRLPKLVGNVPEDTKRIADRLCYVPTTIKGLDRKTIIVVGLAEVLDEMERASRKLTAKDSDLVALDSRNRIDEVRVALSRSTHTLLLVEEPDAFLDEAPMGLGDIPAVLWQDVQKHLREQYQDLDMVERISDLLSSAEESLGRNDLPRARLQTDEAEKLVGSVEDAELQEQVRQLRKQVDHRYAGSQLAVSEGRLEAEDFQEAEKILSELRPLLHRLDDARLNARRDRLEESFSLIKELQLQRNRVLRGEYRSAYEAHKELVARSSRSETTAPKRLASALREDLKAHFEELAGQYWRSAEKARKNGSYTEASSAYQWMAAVRQDQGLHQKAAALECLARRYKELPPPVINEPELSRLVQAIATFVNIMHETEAERSKGAQEIASNWLVELCQALATEPGSYGLLARDIRLLMQSEAVGFAWHNPTFEQAAKKMLVQAVPSLRQQGRFMEALDLAHAFEQAADSEIWAHLQAPKAVSDFLLVVEALYPAERRTLLQMLEQQTEELAETLPAPIDTTKAGTS